MIPLLGTYYSLFHSKKIIMNADELVKIYTDTEMTIVHLKKVLAENGIESLVKNEFESGVSAGFVAGTTSSVELYVFANDQVKAKPIVQQFIEDLQK